MLRSPAGASRTTPRRPPSSVSTRRSLCSARPSLPPPRASPQSSPSATPRAGAPPGRPPRPASSPSARLVHGLGVQSLHHTNASPPGGKVCLELHQLIIKEERDVKNEKWLLVSKQQKRLALSFQRKNALHPSEMQGLLLRVSLKIQISLFGMLGITKHHQHPCVLRTTSTHYSILVLVSHYKGSDLLDSLASKDSSNSC